MGRLRRSRKVAKWTGVAACALILAAWGLSEIWQVYLQSSCVEIWSVDGRLVATKLLNESWELSYELTAVPLGIANRSYGFLLPRFGRDVSYYYLIVPYWGLLLLAAMPTAFLFYLDRRTVLLGHCESCGYDLRSITSGRCPECGTAAVAT